jgi:hypothetical protein
MSNHFSYDIEGIVTFLTAADGGRSTPALSGYRPQFHYDGSDWDAMQTYPDVERVEPGMTIRVLFTFTRPQQHDGKLQVGKPFLIREGRRIVGYGAVTKLLELANSAQRKRGGDVLTSIAPNYPNPGACERNLSPLHGGTCVNCGRTVMPFEGVTTDVEAQLIAHISHWPHRFCDQVLTFSLESGPRRCKVDDRAHVRDGRHPFPRSARCRWWRRLAIA